MKTITPTSIALVCLLSATALGADFFSIQKIDYREKPAKDGSGIYQKTKTLPGVKADSVFVPSIEAQVATKEQTKSSKLFARAHFYDGKGHLVGTVQAPGAAQRGKEKYAMPVFFKKDRSEKLFFPIPEKVRSSSDWKALVVFGDEHGAAVKTFPSGSASFYDYPERAIVEGRGMKIVDRRADMDPVIEYVVKTGNPKQPQITLFVRPPTGVKDGSQVKGVLAMCILANRVGDIRKKLQEQDPGAEVKGLIGFAEKHQLAVLCWGSTNLWNPRMSSDEQSKKVNREMDESFDDVAKAWERGVQELSKKYGIPDRNFMLWGQSGAAQWAHRLALRKPDYFLAVHVHIPSSFDQPTAEADKILWLLTTGELEAGYERATRFYAQCRALGYPMIFKAIMGIAHSGSPIADDLGLRFFEYALSVRDERARYDRDRNDSFTRLKQRGPGPWLDSFKNPEFYGDMVNQECFPAAKVEMIPAAFRVPIPTEILAAAWDK